jgi:Na+/pantothenate symporter
MRDQTETADSAGFIAAAGHTIGHERRRVALAALIASAALAVSTIVAATVVSVGIARAGAVDGVIDNESGLFAVALVLGLLFIGIGGFRLSGRRPHRH